VKRRYSSYSFSNSALDGVSGQRHAPAALEPRGKDLRYPRTGGWVGPRAGLDTQATGKILSPLPGIEHRSSGHPARSQTLYWLSYPAHNIILLPYIIIIIIIIIIITWHFLTFCNSLMFRGSLVDYHCHSQIEFIFQLSATAQDEPINRQTLTQCNENQWDVRYTNAVPWKLQTSTLDYSSDGYHSSRDVEFSTKTDIKSNDLRGTEMLNMLSDPCCFTVIYSISALCSSPLYLAWKREHVTTMLHLITSLMRRSSAFCI
jgi:hypothetical protein